MPAAARIVAALTLLAACAESRQPNHSADPAAVPTADPAAGSQTSELPAFSAVVPRAGFAPFIRAERALPPLSGGTLAVGADGQVVVSDPDRDLVYLVDVKEKRVVSVALQSGDEPGRVVIAGSRAYVALRAGGSLATLDLGAGTLSARTPVCAAPRGVFYDAVESRVLTACAGGELVSVSADGRAVQLQRQLPADLRDVGRDAQGLWISQFRSAALLRLNAGLELTGRALPARVASIAPLDPRTGRASASSELAPTLAYRTVSSSTGAPIMLHQRAQTSPVGVTSFGSYGGGPAGGFCEGGIVHTTLTQFDRDTPLAQAALPQAVVPTDLGVSPDGRVLAVVAPGNFLRQDVVPSGSFSAGSEGFFEGPEGRPAQQLYLVDAAALPREDASVVLGSGPNDCLNDAARWEHRFPGEATAVQFLDAHTLLVQVRNPAELHVFQFEAIDDTRLSAVIPLSTQALRDTGHEVFHQNTGAGIACASCHGEALDDAHVWTFDGVGPRRTQHLRGGVPRTAPFHWSGDLSTFDALIDEVHEKRMGAEPLPSGARSALAGWLDTLPLIPTAAHDADAVTRGRALFASEGVGCARCHAGESLRVPGAFDVGTGGKFKVPSLRGVALRLPLLHNGCADTLEKRFDPGCGGGDLHGTTSQLGAAELADLVAYLGSL